MYNHPFCILIISYGQDAMATDIDNLASNGSGNYYHAHVIIFSVIHAIT